MCLYEERMNVAKERMIVERTIVAVLYDYLVLLYTRIFCNLPCPVVLVRYIEEDLTERVLWTSIAVLTVCLARYVHWSTACLLSVGTHLAGALYYYEAPCPEEDFSSFTKAVCSVVCLFCFASLA